MNIMLFFFFFILLTLSPHISEVIIMFCVFFSIHHKMEFFPHRYFEALSHKLYQPLTVGMVFGMPRPSNIYFGLVVTILEEPHQHF